MSYHATLTAPRADVLEHLADRLSQIAVEHIPPDCRDEYTDHMATILDVVDSMVFGDLGVEGDTYRLTVAGHVNPGHGKREGWAHESMSVSINVM